MKNSQPSFTERKAAPLFAAAVAFLLGAAILNICVGAAGITLPRLWSAILSGPSGTADGRILWYVRLPRTAACILAGAGLSVSGAVIQRVLANQLASPGIIGVNAGAGLAVVVCCAFGVWSAWAIAGAAFIGAVCATFLIVLAAQKSGASRTPVVLGGVAVTACLSAATEAVTRLVPDAAVISADFKVGGFSAIDQARLLPAAVLILAGIVFVCTLTNELDVLSLGDETAHALGARPARLRNLLLTVAALLAGASVSFAGILGFIGLIVPHIARKLIGTESGRLIPFSALLGGGFVAVCDLAARMLFSPHELPTGILLSFVGGPFFIWLLLKRKGKKR
jgi:iron complex transport system permease protein